VHHLDERFETGEGIRDHLFIIDLLEDSTKLFRACTGSEPSPIVCRQCLMDDVALRIRRVVMNSHCGPRRTIPRRTAQDPLVTTHFRRHGV
jgi:hypothetical protein